jgi:hypothetical protein
MTPNPTRRSLIAGAAAAAAFAAPARAHRQHTALSDVSWNPREGRIEIVHRAFAHDVEVAVARAFRRPGAPLQSDEDLARAALYVEERFAAAASEGEDLALATVGAELEGEFVYIYQEVQIPEPPQQLGVKNLILGDAFSDQVNFVNVDLWDDMRTLIFRGNGRMRWARA